jgi:hypothetical protein
MANYLTPAEREKLDLLKPQSRYYGGCRGERWYRHFDTDYQCSGCWDCGGASAHAAHAFHGFVRAASLATTRAELEAGLTGLHAVAALGAAVRDCLKACVAVHGFVQGAVREHLTPRVGRWVTVVGRQGRAKQHYGQSGVVVDSRLTDFGTRQMLVDVGTDRVWIPVGQLLADRMPPEVAERLEEERRLDATRRAAVEARAKQRAAEMATRVKCDASRDALVTCAVARERLNSADPVTYDQLLGVLFWRGVGRGGERLGVRALGPAAPVPPGAPDAAAALQERVEPLWLEVHEARSLRQMTAAEQEAALVALDQTMEARPTDAERLGVYASQLQVRLGMREEPIRVTKAMRKKWMEREKLLRSLYQTTEPEMP